MLTARAWMGGSLFGSSIYTSIRAESEVGIGAEAGKGEGCAIPLPRLVVATFARPNSELIQFARWSAIGFQTTRYAPPYL